MKNLNECLDLLPQKSRCFEKLFGTLFEAYQMWPRGQDLGGGRLNRWRVNCFVGDDLRMGEASG